MNRLYSGYRGREYLSIRQKCEPWYSERVNSSNLDQAVISARQEGLVHFLTPFLPGKNAKMVIADVGGDAGQFMPLALSSHAYVVEASDRLPVDGVVRVPALGDIPFPIDLVICAHVLEHMPSPVVFIEGIAASGNLSQDCLFYVEVPLERPLLSPLLRHSLYRLYLRVIAGVRPLVILVDFLGVVVRSYLGMVFPPLFIKLHEHIHYYTHDSIKVLVERADLDVVASVEERGASLLSTHQGVIRLLARRKSRD